MRRRPRSSAVARRAGRGAVVLVVALLAVLCAPAPPAQAHATLARSEPADGAELAQAPRQVGLWFTEAISLQLSTFEVVKLDGATVPVDRTLATGAAATYVELDLPPLSRGVYTVSWRVLSPRDGHATSGLLAFGVATPAPSVAKAAGGGPVSPLDVVIKWLELCLLAGLIGAFAIGRVVLVPIEGEGGRPAGWRRTARRRIFALAVWVGAEALAVGVAQFVAQLGRLAPAQPAWLDAGGRLLLQTQWGQLWLVRQLLVLGLTAVAVTLWRRERDPQRAPPAVPALVGVLVVALALAKGAGSHAAALTSAAGFAVVVDALHILAAAVWVGGLVALAFGLAPLIRGARPELARQARACVRPFSKVAALSVGVLAATGLYSASRQVASADALLLTSYGRALIGKLGLIGIAGALGLLSAATLHPRVAGILGRLLGRSPDWVRKARTLPTLLVVEASVGVAILLMVAVMASAQPARGPQFAPAADGTTNLVTREAGDTLVTLTVKPNRPGQNVFLVAAANTRKPATGPIAGVTLQLAATDHAGPIFVPTQQVGPGRFRAGGPQLSAAGQWRVDVFVHRTGLPDRVIPFSWTVAPAGEARHVVLSDRPLAPALSWAALAVGGLVLVAPIVLRRRRNSVPEPPPAPAAVTSAVSTAGP